MKGISPSLFLAVLGILVFSSCSLLKPAAVEADREILTKTPLQLPQGRTHPGTVLVFIPETRAVYDTTQMAYQIRSYQIDYFSRTEWGERPSPMLHLLLVQMLQSAHYFSAVVTPPFTGHYTHALQTEILTFYQDFTSEPAAFQLTLRVQMTAQGTNQVIGTKEISVREPMREKTAYAGAVAANDATAKALKEIADFVRETTN